MTTPSLLTAMCHVPSSCTCPPADPSATRREGDKECPEHGLEALARELEGLSLYVLDDGFKCLAANKASAERCRDRHRKPNA